MDANPNEVRRLWCYRAMAYTIGPMIAIFPQCVAFGLILGLILFYSNCTAFHSFGGAHFSFNSDSYKISTKCIHRMAVCPFFFISSASLCICTMLRLWFRCNIIARVGGYCGYCCTWLYIDLLSFFSCCNFMRFISLNFIQLHTQTLNLLSHLLMIDIKSLPITHHLAFSYSIRIALIILQIAKPNFPKKYINE